MRIKRILAVIIIVIVVISGAKTAGDAEIVEEKATETVEIVKTKHKPKKIYREKIDLPAAVVEIPEPPKRKAETPEEKLKKEELLEEALDGACRVPLDIMKACGRAIELSQVFAEKGSVMATSDAGASAILCKSAMEAASLNVYINTNSMRDRDKAQALNRECEECLQKYTKLADEVFGYVVRKLKHED